MSFDGPALKGAENVVHRRHRPPRDLRSARRRSPQTCRFITGSAPATLGDRRPEARVVLDGKVSGLGLDNRQGSVATNLPLAGATVEVYATDAATRRARRAPPLHRKTDRRRRPLGTVRRRRARRAYEFVIAAPGYAIDAHLPLAVPALVARSCNLRAERLRRRRPATRQRSSR